MTAVGDLLVGFDSAWTAKRSGAIVGILRRPDGSLKHLGAPATVGFAAAASTIRSWQDQHSPASTLILIDQPTVVHNSTGQRPVEHIVSSPVSRRYGGVQPANTGRLEMFGRTAPLWPFLEEFGGAADPLSSGTKVRVFETYPVLTAIALGWCLPDTAECRQRGRLPKYNPERRRTFAPPDWRHMCEMVKERLRALGAHELADSVALLARKEKPSKPDQDKLDACICLIVGLQISSGGAGLVVGDAETGYIVVPDSDDLREELRARCLATGRQPEHWVRSLGNT